MTASNTFDYFYKYIKNIMIYKPFLWDFNFSMKIYPFILNSLNYYFINQYFIYFD